MAITYIGNIADYAPDSNSAVTLNFSSLSPQAGDLAVVIINIVNLTTDVTFALSTSGYTKIADLYISDTRDANLGVFYKIISYYVNSFFFE